MTAYISPGSYEVNFPDTTSSVFCSEFELSPGQTDDGVMFEDSAEAL